MAQVKTTFDKEYISGDRELFERISKPNHGVNLHHEHGDEFLTYYTGKKPENKRGQLPTQNPNWLEVHTITGRVENTSNVKVNPDDRYKRQTA